MGDTTLTRSTAHCREVMGALAVRLCALQAVRLATGAVLLLPPESCPDAGDYYCGWPVIRCGCVPEPMIGLPGRERGTQGVREANPR
jgi:hypothetical protein